MLHVVPVASARSPGPPLMVRLLRRWRQARMAGLNPLPEMSRLARRCGCGIELATASDSCFMLTEACLGRQLRTQGRSSRQLSADEAAILELLVGVPLLADIGPNMHLPHGLPGALQWAAMTVVRALGHVPLGHVPLSHVPLGGWHPSCAQRTGCPFAAAHAGYW